MAASPNFTALPPSNSPLLNLDQVEDLLKLQKAAQKISSILDLDQLVDKVVNEVARSFGKERVQIRRWMRRFGLEAGPFRN